jgi:protein-disulfide isomerase
LCEPAARFVWKGVRDGLSKEQVEERYAERFDQRRVKELEVDGAPSIGPEGAPVTLVEFFDYQCPVCVDASPILEKAVARYPVRVVFKFWPLPMHAKAEPAARAALAAHAQGKFAAMHAVLFAKSPAFGPEDLEEYARGLKLDMVRFRADLSSAWVTAQLARDKALAKALGLHGTPTIFVNGRQVPVRGDLDDWISMELAVRR